MIVKFENETQGTDIAFDQSSLVNAFHIYSSYIQRYVGQDRPFFSFGGKKGEEKMEKVIKMALDCGVSTEIFIKAQFEECIPILKFVGAKIKYPPLAMLAGPKAIQRFQSWMKKVGMSYEQPVERRKEILSSPFPRYTEPMKKSAEEFHQRLLRVKSVYGEVNRELATKQMELMARGGQLSEVYIASSPLVDNNSPSYLLQLRAKVKSILKSGDMDIVKKIRAEIEAEYRDEVGRYV